MEKPSVGADEWTNVRREWNEKKKNERIRPETRVQPNEKRKIAGSSSSPDQYLHHQENGSNDGYECVPVQ